MMIQDHFPPLVRARRLIPSLRNGRCRVWKSGVRKAQWTIQLLGGRDQVITVFLRILLGSFKHNENERSCPKMRSVFLGGFLLNQNERSHYSFQVADAYQRIDDASSSQIGWVFCVVFTGIFICVYRDPAPKTPRHICQEKGVYDLLVVADWIWMWVCCWICPSKLKKPQMFVRHSRFITQHGATPHAQIWGDLSEEVDYNEQLQEAPWFWKRDTRPLPGRSRRLNL